MVTCMGSVIWLSFEGGYMSIGNRMDLWRDGYGYRQVLHFLYVPYCLGLISIQARDFTLCLIARG